MTTVYLAVDLEDGESGSPLDDVLESWQFDEVIDDLVSEVDCISLNDITSECDECSSCGGHEVAPRVYNVTVMSEADLRRRFTGQQAPAVIGAPIPAGKPPVY